MPAQSFVNLDDIIVHKKKKILLILVTDSETLGESFEAVHFPLRKVSKCRPNSWKITILLYLVKAYPRNFKDVWSN